MSATRTDDNKDPPTMALEAISFTELTEALQGLKSLPYSSIKLPTYNGPGDLELFLEKFTDVAKINGWSHEEHLLHLWLSLTEKAADYSNGTTITEVHEMPNVRFGISSRPAREKLLLLKRTTKRTVHELGMEVRKLTRLSYPALRD